ncbi:hypothetical protein BGZ65_007211 [Modicella reniformis]|uniref:Uncharacterized protein n=1 Tax=Modicella reniformis TaxID=1440133 RepID=A0A9P6MB54_9FUNG|nr:hypothetical protein BGZ65_007211 [Modicella reniformis]
MDAARFFQATATKTERSGFVLPTDHKRRPVTRNAASEMRPCLVPENQDKHDSTTERETDMANVEVQMRRMIEVSYWHQGEPHASVGNSTSISSRESDIAADPQPTLLTAFAAQPDQIPTLENTETLFGSILGFS